MFRRNKSCISIVSKAVLSFFVAVSCFSGISMAGSLDRIIIVVNDEVVTQREFDRVFQPIKRSLEDVFSGAELERRLAEAEDGVREHLINAKLAASLAKRKNLEIDEEELSQRIEVIKRSYYENEQEFLMALQARGTNLTEFKREIREQMLAQKLVEQEVAAHIVVTPGQIREVYEENKEDMIAPEQALVRTIMVSKDRERSDADSMRKMEQIAEMASNTDDFASLAAERSEGPYAMDGGLMGYIARGQTIPAIDNVIFALDEGEISEVVETPIGFHIFLVEEIQEPRQLELAEVSDFLREQIFMGKFQEKLVEYLEEQREKAHISFN